MNVTYRGFFPPRAVDRDGLIVVDGGEVKFNVPDKSPAVIRQRMRQFVDLLLSLPDDQKGDFPVEHRFVDGMYMRRLFIAKGQILAGKVHRKECINFVESGDISILTETGCGRIKAGHLAVSAAGIQKLGYAHEDTVFVNVFRTDETDIDVIEAQIATEDYAAIDYERGLTCL